MAHHPTLGHVFHRNRTERYQRLSNDLDKIGAYKHWLSAINCKCVVTTNEQLDPAAHLICAAKELGIETIQILHGIPTRLYTPMLSDQLWVWHETQSQTFQEWGLRPEQLQVSGFLEPLNTFQQKLSGDIAPTSTEGTPPQQDTNVLIASQWQGSQLWDTPHFQEAMAWIANQDMPAGTQLQIRFHPHDTATDKAAIKNLFNQRHPGATYHEATSLPLETQLNAASKVITASSTVVMWPDS